MKILFLDRTYELDNVAKEKEIIDFIKDLLNKSRLYFSHIIADENEIYDLEEYIYANSHELNEIVVIGKTANELAKDTLLSVGNYIEEGLPQIKELSDAFAVNPKKENWDQLIHLIDGLDWLISGYEYISYMNFSNEELLNCGAWNEYSREVHMIKGILEDFQKVIENNDFISISDILNYEIIPKLILMKKQLAILLINY